MNSKLFLLWASEKVRESKNMLEAKKSPKGSGGDDPAQRDREEAAEIRQQAIDAKEDARRREAKARRILGTIKTAAEISAQDSTQQRDPLPSTVMDSGSNLDYLKNLGVDAGFQSMSASGGRGQSHHYQRIQEALKAVIDKELK
jgi:hypothetical protein